MNYNMYCPLNISSQRYFLYLETNAVIIDSTVIITIFKFKIKFFVKIKCFFFKQGM